MVRKSLVEKVGKDFCYLQSLVHERLVKVSDYYILEGKKVISCNMEDWLVWLKQKREKGCSISVGSKTKNNVHVSTIFLGMNHRFGEGEPLIFETMIFRGELDGKQWRYSSHKEAVVGHKRACRLAFGKTRLQKTGGTIAFVGMMLYWFFINCSTRRGKMK